MRECAACKYSLAKDYWERVNAFVILKNASSGYLQYAKPCFAEMQILFYHRVPLARSKIPKLAAKVQALLEDEW